MPRSYSHRGIRQTLLLVIIGVAILGCTKGPFWRSGYLSPWARQQWAAEEQIAASLRTRESDMRATVQTALRGSIADQTRAAEQLAQIAQNDSVVLARAEAVRLLGQLDSRTAREAVAIAAIDPLSEIRLAAVQACGEFAAPESVQVLQQIVGGDTDVDVRLAATRALRNHRGPQVVRALGLALDDPDPALQSRAAESLQVVTGERFGQDLPAWREFVRNTAPPPPAPAAPEMEERPVKASGILR